MELQTSAKVELKLSIQRTILYDARIQLTLVTGEMNIIRTMIN